MIIRIAYLKLIFACESIEGSHDLIQCHITFLVQSIRFIDQDGVKLALEAICITLKHPRTRET
jgi:hypothetical protein